MALAFVNVALMVNLCLAATLFAQDSPPTPPVNKDQTHNNGDERECNLHFVSLFVT
jgi:hypothetical protein